MYIIGKEEGLPSLPSKNQQGVDNIMMTIKEAREEAGLTQKEVFELIGVPIRTLQNYEAGIRVCPEWVEKLLIQEILKHKKNNP